jgi:hypothetical protein
MSAPQKNPTQRGVMVQFEHVQFRQSASVPAPDFSREQLVAFVRRTEQARTRFRGTIVWLDKDRHPFTTLATT